MFKGFIGYPFCCVSIISISKSNICFWQSVAGNMNERILLRASFPYKLSLRTLKQKVEENRPFYIVTFISMIPVERTYSMLITWLHHLAYAHHLASITTLTQIFLILNVPCLFKIQLGEIIHRCGWVIRNIKIFPLLFLFFIFIHVDGKISLTDTQWNYPY